MAHFARLSISGITLLLSTAIQADFQLIWRQCSALRVSGRGFAPAVLVLNRLRYPQKFLLITALFALPLGVVMSFFMSVVQHDIEFSEHEKVGVDYIRPLHSVVQHVQQHRALTVAFRAARPISEPGTKPSSSRFRKISSASMQPIADSIRSSAARTLEGGEAALGRATASIATSTPQAMADMHKARYRSAADQARGRHPNLILDADLDAYYLMMLS